MREIRLSGSEGGGAESNRLFLPLSFKGGFSREPRIMAPPSQKDENRAPDT
jgi:hypothetical protein